MTEAFKRPIFRDDNFRGREGRREFMDKEYRQE